MTTLLNLKKFIPVMISVAIIGAIRNRRQSGNRQAIPSGANTAYWIILGISIVNLLFVAGIAWGAMGGLTNELLDPPLVIQVVLGIGVVSAVLTAGALVYTLLAWKNRYWGIAGRVFYTLATVAALAFVWFMNNWNLLGWRY